VGVLPGRRSEETKHMSVASDLSVVVHEAGHAILACALGHWRKPYNTKSALSIVPRGKLVGFARTLRAWGNDSVAVSLAGPLAEGRFTGFTEVSGSDVESIALNCSPETWWMMRCNPDHHETWNTMAELEVDQIEAFYAVVWAAVHQLSLTGAFSEKGQAWVARCNFGEAFKTMQEQATRVSALLDHH